MSVINKFPFDVNGFHPFGQLCKGTVQTNFSVKKGQPLRFYSDLSSLQSNITFAKFNSDPTKAELIEIDNNTCVCIYGASDGTLAARLVYVSDDATLSLDEEVNLSSDAYSGRYRGIAACKLSSDTVFIAHFIGSSYHIGGMVIQVKNNRITKVQDSVLLYNAQTGQGTNYKIDCCLLADGRVCVLHPYTGYYGLQFTVLSIDSDYTITVQKSSNTTTETAFRYNYEITPLGYYSNTSQPALLCSISYNGTEQFYMYRVAEDGSIVYISSVVSPDSYSGNNAVTRMVSDSKFTLFSSCGSSYYPYFRDYCIYGNGDGTAMFYSRNYYYVYSSNSYGAGAGGEQYNGSDVIYCNGDAYYFGPLDSGSSWYLKGYKFCPGSNNTGSYGLNPASPILLHQANRCAYWTRAIIVGTNIVLLNCMGDTCYVSSIRGYIKPCRATSTGNFFGFALEDGQSGDTVEYARVWKNVKDCNTSDVIS